MRAAHRTRLLTGIAIAAVALVMLWRPPQSHAGAVVLCEQVTCTTDGDCGQSGSCVGSTCRCATDDQCPMGTVCLGGNFCAICPPTRTPTVTPTSTTTPTRTDTATPTASATPTDTGMPGSACTDPSQCSVDFCVDGVCCLTECDGPAEACNVSGNGVCTSITATAPAMSGRGSLLAVFLLGGVGLWALARRRYG